MPERPLLILPSPGEPLERGKKRGFGAKLHLPSIERQVERLSPEFAVLQRALDARRARLQVEAHDVVPEEVVVLETVGTVDQFIRAVEKVPGLEWLGEVESREIPPDDDFFALTDKGEAHRTKPLRGRVFMIFVNHGALQQMISLWKRWRSGEKLPHGLGKWKTLFKQLHDVRHWGVRDRLLETGVLEDWQERVDQGEEVVPCEIEFWYRRSSQRRRASQSRVTALVEAMAGEVIAGAEIGEITYHSLLVRLPVAGVRPLLESLDGDLALVQCEQIQFFRASGQMSSALPANVGVRDMPALSGEHPVGNPVVALFDGLPLQAHGWLRGRLEVDDPDRFEDDYPAVTRRHGTAMASLIVHGDIGAGEEPLSRPLYVRPILQQDSRDWRNHTETVPEGVLVVDLVHRAVRRLFEGEGDEPAVAPHVAVINLSVGIRDRPFEQLLSPFARLLDWLAWRYQVLFVVSAGNHAGPIRLVSPQQSAMPPVDGVQEQLIRSVAADARNRRLLSPAEAVNALTVASVHKDASTAPPPIGWE